MNQMTFKEEIENYHWEKVQSRIQSMTPRDVEKALDSQYLRIDDVMALLSPAAESFMEEMAQLAHQITVKRFGRVINLYAPIYVSNECSSTCLYCGFSRKNRVVRKTLTVDEVIIEGKVLYEQGFRHVLLVSGESPGHVSSDYLCQISEQLKAMFSSISIEIYSMKADKYSTLIKSGIDGMTMYQETYDRKRFKEVHLGGIKKDYNFRLETPDCGWEAGFRRLNIGMLLGLSDWRTDGFFLGLHASYLLKKYWKSHVFVSFPRLRPAAGCYHPEFKVEDKNLVQLLCALRIWQPDAGIVLSTRESKELRYNLIPLGITQMSAGSNTAPGGYASGHDAEGQFEVNDCRTPEEVARMIVSRGYEPVWKDWDRAFLNN